MEANSTVVIVIIIFGVILLYLLVSLKSLYINSDLLEEPVVSKPEDLLTEKYSGFKRIIAFINYEKLNRRLKLLTEATTIMFLCVIFILLLIVFILLNSLEHIYTFIISFLPIILSAVISTVIYKAKFYESIIKRH